MQGGDYMMTTVLGILLMGNILFLGYYIKEYCRSYGDVKPVERARRKINIHSSIIVGLLCCFLL